MAETPDKIIEVPGMGNVAFPGSMADDEISGVVRSHIATNALQDKVSTYPSSFQESPEAKQASGEKPSEHPTISQVLQSSAPGLTAEYPKTTKAIGAVGDTLAGVGAEGISQLGRVAGYVSPRLGKALGPTIDKYGTPPPGMAPMLGKIGLNTAEFMLPGAGEEKAASAIGDALSSAPSVVRGAAKLLPGAFTSGTVNAIQGGDFGTGAAVGAGSGLVGNAAKAMAPSIADSALGVTRRLRTFGKTPGKSFLDEVSGIKPSTVLAQASEKTDALTNQLETAMGNSPAQVTTNSALGVIDNAISKYKSHNAPEIYEKLGEIRNRLTHNQETGQAFPPIRSATDVLNLKRGIGDLVGTWTPEQKQGIKGVLPRVYGALDKELDTAVPGTEGLNQRISSLIPVKERARALEEGAEIPQRLMGRFGAVTGAMAPALLGSGLGYAHNGPEGALIGGTAGFLLPELMNTPTVKMLAARTLNSSATPRLTKAMLLQMGQDQRKDNAR